MYTNKIREIKQYKYMKKILFLSPVDFKEKSIQVIRKTPEAYASSGWEVDYIVARDNYSNGDYFYEKEFNLANVNVIRVYWPFPKLRAKLPRFLELMFSKIVRSIVIYRLVKKGITSIRKKKYDVIYGFSSTGILAITFLRLLGYTKKSKIVSRILGVWLWKMLKDKSYIRLLFNLDEIWAIKAKADLMIMTNDGTEGDKAIQYFNRKRKKSFVFWTNGVDLVEESNWNKQEFIQKYDLYNKKIFLSISRLVHWKRIDRGIFIINALVNKGITDIKYLIVGEGYLKSQLQRLVKDLDIEKYIIFVGGIEHSLIKEYLKCADFFISMYDLSNVGNPLLEAIRYNKFIVTLNNGDTGNWIKHKKNGLIYNLDLTNIYDIIATDIIDYMNNRHKYDEVIENIKITEKKRLWTRDERLAEEINAVSNLL